MTTMFNEGFIVEGIQMYKYIHTYTERENQGQKEGIERKKGVRKD